MPDEGPRERVERHIAALRLEGERRQLHADARTANAIGTGGGFRLLLAAGLVPVDIDGRIAIVLPIVPIRGTGQGGYFETPFFEDVACLN